MIIRFLIKLTGAVNSFENFVQQNPSPANYAQNQMASAVPAQIVQAPPPPAYPMAKTQNFFQQTQNSVGNMMNFMKQNQKI